MKACPIFIAAAVVSLMLASPARAADGVVGTILEVEGSATVTPESGAAAPAAVNAQLHLDDTVQTQAGSRVYILFIDDTQMTLSENTKMKIDNYVFDAADTADNKAHYSALEGAFQYVSGLIGHKENPDVQVETPVGSIGIRGTDFWAGNLDGKYSVAVNDGQVGLRNETGDETVVNKGEGTSVADRFHAPERPQAWSQEKRARAGQSVRLRNYAAVRQRVLASGGRQQQLRGQYRNFMQAHRRGHDWADRPRDRQQHERWQRRFGNGNRGENRGLNRPERREEQRRGMRGEERRQEFRQRRQERREHQAEGRRARPEHRAESKDRHRRAEHRNAKGRNMGHPRGRAHGHGGGGHRPAGRARGKGRR
jgi:hypothetical protein